MLFYFVRHGEIDSNIRKIYAGWSDEGLTERGARQAEKAGKFLRGKGIDSIYCSPLRRTVQTAQIIGRVIGRVPVADEHFKELKMGPWEGMSEDGVARAYPEEWRVWNERPAELVLDERETLKELQDRVLEGIGRRRAGNIEKTCLAPQYDLLDLRGKQRRPSTIARSYGAGTSAKGFSDFPEATRVVVVTHVAIVRVLKLYAEGRDLNEYKKVPVSNGEIFELDDSSWLIGEDDIITPVP